MKRIEKFENPNLSGDIRDSQSLHSRQILSSSTDQSILSTNSSDSNVLILSQMNVFGAGDPEKRINNDIKQEIAYNIDQKIIGIMNSKQMEVATGMIPTQEVAHAIMQEAENQLAISSTTTSTDQEQQLKNRLRSNMADNMLHNSALHQKLALDVANNLKGIYTNIDVNNVSVEIYQHMSEYSSFRNEGEFTAMLENDYTSTTDQLLALQHYGRQHNQPSEIVLPDVIKEIQSKKDESKQEKKELNFDHPDLAKTVGYKISSIKKMVNNKDRVTDSDFKKDASELQKLLEDFQSKAGSYRLASENPEKKNEVSESWKALQDTSFQSANTQILQSEYITAIKTLLQ